MNGAHDLGGRHGYGPINPEPEAEEPVFHAAWERRAFGLNLAVGALGQWNIDMSRHARERQHPVDYLRHTYYENWLAGLEKLLVEKGLVTAAELAAGKASGPADLDTRKRILKAENVAQVLAQGAPVAISIDLSALAQCSGTHLCREGPCRPRGHAPAIGGMATRLSPHAPRSAGRAVACHSAGPAGCLTPPVAHGTQLPRWPRAH